MRLLIKTLHSSLSNRIWGEIFGYNKQDQPTPLYVACRGGHLKNVEYLLSLDDINVNEIYAYTHDKNTTNYYTSPLCAAAARDYSKIVIQLLINDADYQSKIVGCKGFPNLMTAKMVAGKNSIQIIKAYINIKRGETAYGEQNVTRIRACFARACEQSIDCVIAYLSKIITTAIAAHAHGENEPTCPHFQNLLKMAYKSVKSKTFGIVNEEALNRLNCKVSEHIMGYNANADGSQLFDDNKVKGDFVRKYSDGTISFAGAMDKMTASTNESRKSFYDRALPVTNLFHQKKQPANKGDRDNNNIPGKPEKPEGGMQQR